MRIPTSLPLLIATLWVGSLWTVGYVVAPTLFATLADRALAGSIAGSLLRVEAWLSLACAAVLLTLHFMSRPLPATSGSKAVPRLILAMVTCTLVGYFGLQPFMASIREAAAASGGMDEAARRQFGMLHGVASGVFLLQSLLGVALIVKIGRAVRGESTSG